jgi:hypothetical protein
VAIARNQKDQTFDYALRLKDAGLVAASAAAQVSSADKILDMGAQRFDGRVIVDISACETDTGNEKYIILVQGSDSSSFGGTTAKNLGALVVGDSSVALEGIDTPATTRREIHFCNEVDGHSFRYIRLYTQIAGTIGTGINYTANLVQHV